MDRAYAPLFARDLFDDAEETSLALYRAAISKGIAPPIAVGRVAAVYGVPYRHLGTYAAMATDPKANPIALADAADRVLLTFVSKTVDAEAAQTKELVSKAPSTAVDVGVDELEAMWEEGEHPRGDDGRFTTGQADPIINDPARLALVRSIMGLGAQSAPRVDTEPAKASTTAKRRGRLQKINAATAAHRKRKAKAEPSAVIGRASDPANLTRARSARAKASQARTGQLSASKLRAHRVNAALEADNAVEDYVPTRANAIFPRSLLDMPSKYDFGASEDVYEKVGVQKVYSLTKKEGIEFIAAAGGPKDGRIFRLGWLADATGQGSQKDTTAAALAMETAANVAKVTEFGGPHLLVEPTIIEVDLIDMPAPEIHIDDDEGMALAENDYLTGQIDEYLTNWVQLPSGEMVQETSAQEGRHIFKRTDYTNKDRDTNIRLLVHVHSSAAGSKNFQQDRPRPFAKVVEVYVDHPQGRVDDEGTRSGEADVPLDPNQAYVLGPVETMYDRERQVLVDRYSASPVDEDEVRAAESIKGWNTHKALDTLERTAFNQEHPRAGGGRFTNTMDRPSGVAPSTIPDADYERMSAIREMIHAKPSPSAAQERQARRSRRISRVQRTNRIGRLQRTNRAKAVERRAIAARPAPAPRPASSGRLQATTARATSAKVGTVGAAQAKARHAVVARVKNLLGQPKPGGTRVLDDSQQYMALSVKTFKALLKDRKNKIVGSAEVPDEIDLSAYSAGQLMERNLWSPEAAIETIGRRAANMAKAVGLEDLSGPMPLRPDNHDDAESVFREITKLLKRYPHLGYLYLEQQPDYSEMHVSDEFGRIEIEDDWEDEGPESATDSVMHVIRGNVDQLDPVYLIELDKSVDWKSHDMDLVLERSYVSNALATGPDTGTEEPDPYDHEVDLTGEQAVHAVKVFVYKAYARDH